MLCPEVGVGEEGGPGLLLRSARGEKHTGLVKWAWCGEFSLSLCRPRGGLCVGVSVGACVVYADLREGKFCVRAFDSVRYLLIFWEEFLCLF